MNSNEYTELINEFIVCINETRYYDAHETLEKIWFPRRFEKSPEMNLIKGFINAAVSFEVIKRGRPKSAIKVWETYEKYIILLGTFESPHNSRYIELDQFLRQKKSELSSNI
ncbi:MAG: hypothetical protein COA44_02655 [Arcobacter sp.]|nr:MAG: hypothetical protein COA44_02655 [Arcobacter sp.]